MNHPKQNKQGLCNLDYNNHIIYQRLIKDTLMTKLCQIMHVTTVYIEPHNGTCLFPQYVFQGGQKRGEGGVVVRHFVNMSVRVHACERVQKVTTSKNLKIKNQTMCGLDLKSSYFCGQKIILDFEK